MSLLQDLEDFGKIKTGKKKTGLRKNTFDLPQGTLTSWKFNDWDYYRGDLPVHARGLFMDGDTIVARGYDKFFNIGETPATKWESIAKTQGPYECTSKENGCIVFVAAFKGELIVTSKHSVGNRDDLTKNHSAAGLNWVRKHLRQAGVSEAELVRELETNNWTAVGELCDDTFEEHVLSYDTRPGIYLTGLNENTREFKTRPFSEVQAFARRFGFIVTDYCQFDTLSEMRAFVDKCAETGAWNGREIEGFVVRCKTAEGRTFFFKYKFEEPYFMYRQWREATKAFIKDPTTVPRLHARHAASCQKYLEFASRYIAVHPELKESIPEGKGIIELRKKFLETQDEAALLALGLHDLQEKIVLVPVATLGCGKTTVAKALQELIGCALAQNDDIPGGKTKQATMIRRCCELLETNDILFFDRNNHQRRERDQLFKDMGATAGLRGWKLRYICLNFLPYGPGKKSWQVTTERVLARGDDHQTITGMPPQMVEGIMKGFVGRFEPVVASRAPDDEFDSIVDLDVAKGSKENVLRVLAKLKEYGINSGDAAGDVDAAMDKALAYKGKAIVAPTTLSKLVQFFGVQVDASELDDIVLPEGYKRLPEFHVTVAHCKSHPKAFKEVKAEYALKLEVPYVAKSKSKTIDLGVPVTVVVKSLCQNKKVVALSVECSLSDNTHPHITVGVAPGAKPVESNEMLKDPETTRDVHKVLQGRLLAYL